jgi:hypothetical protein
MPICVISQPRLFPGLHYLHRMMVADVFVILDSVQFNPRHEENRAKVKGPNGAQWLTAPMRHGSREQLISDTLVDASQPWQRRALATLQQFYGKAACYQQHSAAIQKVLEQPYETLTQLDRASWEPALRLLGVNCQFVLASELPVSGRGPQLLLDICRQLGADTYLSGAFGKEYLDAAEFAQSGVTVLYHQYQYPEYEQRFGGPFLPYLSYLDVLFNRGLDATFVAAGGSVELKQPEPVPLASPEL